MADQAPDGVETTSVPLVLWRAAIIPIVTVGSIATLIGAVRSPAEGVGAAVGSLLAGFAFSLGPVILKVGKEASPPAMMAVALTAYMSLIGILAVIYLLLLDRSWFSVEAAGWAIFACSMASLIGTVRAVRSLRIYAFGTPVPSDSQPVGRELG